jgi:hypothetical protein
MPDHRKACQRAPRVRRARYSAGVGGGRHRSAGLEAELGFCSGRGAFELDYLVGIDVAAGKQLRPRVLGRHLQLGRGERIGLGHGIGRITYRAEKRVVQIADAPPLCSVPACPPV